MEINLAIIDFNPGQGGGVNPSGTLDISENGVYNVYTYASASVDVHPSISLSETYISNGSYNITGEFNGGVITVDVPAPQFVTETLNVSANGTYTPSEGIDGYSQVVVDVPQSVIGYTEKEMTEGLCITNLNNSASFVGGYKFANNSCLTTVNLPMCSRIDDNAFNNCYSLTTIDLPMCESVGNYAFYNCRSLSAVNLPVCSYICSNVFDNCYSLTTIDLPMCESVGDYAFYNCRSLSAVNLPVCSYVGGYAFRYCRSLSAVNLPMCRYINGYAFGSTSLVSLSLPRLTKISGYATFEHCESLSSLYFPKLRVINGAWTFNDCINLSILDIPAVTIEGYDLVERDSNLKELYINSETYIIPSYILSETNSGITSIYTNINNVSRFIAASGWSTYSDKIVGVGDPSVFMLSYSDGVINGMTKLIEQGYYSYLDMSIDVARTNVVSVDLPNCDYIFPDTFNGYTGLTNISLPNCEYIEDFAFHYCISLSAVNLPMCSYIGGYAFHYCISLSAVNLPMCSYIGYGAFSYCSSLSVAYIGTGIDKVCVLNDIAAFFYCPALTSIYVPASLVESYKTATNWTYYSDKIVGI